MNRKGFLVFLGNLALIATTGAANDIYILNYSKNPVIITVKNRGINNPDEYVAAGKSTRPLSSTASRGDRVVMVHEADPFSLSFSYPTKLLAVGTYDPTPFAPYPVFVVYSPDPNEAGICGHIKYYVRAKDGFTLLNGNPVTDEESSMLKGFKVEEQEASGTY